jgi:hypothetical protein
VAVAGLAVAGASVLVAVFALVQARRANRTAEEALAWQQQRDLERRTPTLTVEIEHREQQERQYVHSVADPRPVRHVYSLEISVVNTGETTEHLRRLRVGSADRTEWIDVLGDKDRVIGPRARIPAEVLLTTIPKHLDGFLAVATLADGHEIESAIERPDDILLASIEAHNRNARP